MENSVDKTRTKIFYYSAICVIVGELVDNIFSNQTGLALFSGYFVIGISIPVILLRFRNILNNLWANSIILYSLILTITLTTYLAIGTGEFSAFFIRFIIIVCVIVPYAGFNMQIYHSIIVGIFFVISYVTISMSTGDKNLIYSLPVVIIIMFAYVFGIYLLIHNFFLAYNEKKELLEKAEQANNTLTARKEELKEAIESKNALFSIIYHDLRNPFNTIMGFNDLIEIALRKNDFDKVRKYHPLIKRSTENAYMLTKNLFDWARAQKEDVNFIPHKFPLKRLVDEVIGLVSNDAKQKRINITADIPVDHMIVADNNMIASVIRNLANNAIKFTPKNGEIKIGLKSRENKIIYYVKDTGVGASREKLQKMFSGKRIESEPGTMNEQGSGLGLNICKGFIEKHHGKIWAETNIDSGITVFFTIGI